MKHDDVTLSTRIRRTLRAIGFASRDIRVRTTYKGGCAHDVFVCLLCPTHETYARIDALRANRFNVWVYMGGNDVKHVSVEYAYTDDTKTHIIRTRE